MKELLDRYEQLVLENKRLRADFSDASALVRIAPAINISTCGEELAEAKVEARAMAKRLDWIFRWCDMSWSHIANTPPQPELPGNWRTKWLPDDEA